MPLGGVHFGSHGLLAVVMLMALTSFLLITSPVRLRRLQIFGRFHSDMGCLQPPFIEVSATRLQLRIAGLEYNAVPFVRTRTGRLELDQLVNPLADVHRQQPDQSEVVLQVDDEIEQEDLARVIDTCIGAGFPSVSVSPALIWQRGDASPLSGMGGDQQAAQQEQAETAHQRSTRATAGLLRASER